MENTDRVLSSKGKGNESSRAGRKIENHGGVFGEFFWWFGCYSLIWWVEISYLHGQVGIRCYGHALFITTNSNVSLGKIMKNVEQ